MAEKIRDAAGGAWGSRGKFYMRVTIATQTRPSVLLPWCASLPDAKQRAGIVQGYVNRLRTAGPEAASFVETVMKLGAAADDETLTELSVKVDAIVGDNFDRVVEKPARTYVSFEDFAMRWVRGEFATIYPDHVPRKRTASTDLVYLQRYVFPVVGDMPIEDVTLEHYEQVMREIPARARMVFRTPAGGGKRRAERAKLRPGTRKHIAQVMRMVLGIAEYPAKLIARNPVPASALPKGRTTVALQFVYPDEDTALMGKTAIDLGYRLVYGFLARMGWRKADALGGKVDEVDGAAEADELDDIEPLTWSRLDLKRGAVYIDRDKTGDPRPMALDPGVCRALKAWREMHPDAQPTDHVFVDDTGKPIEPEALVGRFRDHLRLALGSEARAELFERTTTRQPIRLHDLRASFVSVAFANGREEKWIRDRTGHRSGALDRYARVARTIAELDLGDWTSLEAAIPEFAAASAAANRGGKSGPIDDRATVTDRSARLSGGSEIHPDEARSARR